MYVNNLSLGKYKFNTLLKLDCRQIFWITTKIDDISHKYDGQ